MPFSPSHKTDYQASPDVKSVSQKLENCIESLNSNFTKDRLSEVRKLFKKAAKQEKLKNEDLLKEVQNLNSVLDIISQNQRNKSNLKAHRDNQQIVKILNQILKITT